jgi:hypothetical protein
MSAICGVLRVLSATHARVLGGQAGHRTEERQKRKAASTTIHSAEYELRETERELYVMWKQQAGQFSKFRPSQNGVTEAEHRYHTDLKIKNLVTFNRNLQAPAPPALLHASSPAPSALDLALCVYRLSWRPADLTARGPRAADTNRRHIASVLQRRRETICCAVVSGQEGADPCSRGPQERLATHIHTRLRAALPPPLPRPCAGRSVPSAWRSTCALRARE